VGQADPLACHRYSGDVLLTVVSIPAQFYDANGELRLDGSLGGGIAQRIVTLTDTQIKAMDDTHAVPIIAATQTLSYAGSPARVYVPIYATALLNNAAGAYTNTPLTMGLQLCWGSDFSVQVGVGQLSQDVNVYNAFTNPVSDSLIDFPPTALQVSQLAANLNDNGLYIAWKGGAGPLTGGNVANSMTVTVWYVTLDNPYA
jgi:hypothetical protein